MMRTVQLHGRLADQFGGAPFELDIASLGEAVRALVATLPGFRNALRQGCYRIEAEHGQRSLELGLEDLRLTLGKVRALHLIPVAEGAAIEGAGGGGSGKIILGVALIAGSVLLGPAGFGVVAAGSTFMGMGLGSVAMVGASLVLAGVSQIMAPSFKSPGVPKHERLESFMFHGPVNVMEQGHPVPLVIGRFRAGSVVVSAGLDTSDTELTVTEPEASQLFEHNDNPSSWL